MAEEMNGNGTPPARIPDWGQWLATEMRTGFENVNRRMDEVVKEPNRRLDGLESKVDSIDTAIDTERQERRALQGSIGAYKWIAGFIGLPGMAALILWLVKTAIELKPA